jgi:hypothetical protein
MAMGLAAGPAMQAAAQSLKPDEVYSSIGVTPIAPPTPVRGADHRIHLAYELEVTNPSRLFVTLDKVEALDPRGAVLSSLHGAALAGMLTNQGPGGATIAPGGTATVFMSTSFGAGTRLPAAIAPRLTATRQSAGPGGKPAPFPANAGLPATFTFTAPPIRLATAPAVVIDPPLRGAAWVAMNGCCDELTSHRGAVMAINGVLRVPERFAIDWMQLRPDHRLYTGDRAALASYKSFGAEVHAVADGRVVNLYNAAPEQVPGQKPAGIVPENIGGNMLVVDIGGGAYAFYAHLQPGSLRVKLNGRVRRGQVLGLVGNTGNSDAPHLHFHVMDGPSPLDANSLPYVLTSFTTAGVLDEASADAVFEKGAPAVVKPGADDGAHRDELPLNLQVVDFAE